MSPVNRAVRVVVEWNDRVPGEPTPPGGTLAEMIAKEIREAVDDEREACAKLCDSFAESWRNCQGKNSDGASACESLAIQVRGRSEPMTLAELVATTPVAAVKAFMDTPEGKRVLAASVERVFGSDAGKAAQP